MVLIAVHEWRGRRRRAGSPAHRERRCRRARRCARAHGWSRTPSQPQLRQAISSSLLSEREQVAPHRVAPALEVVLGGGEPDDLEAAEPQGGLVAAEERRPSRGCRCGSAGHAPAAARRRGLVVPSLAELADMDGHVVCALLQDTGARVLAVRAASRRVRRSTRRGAGARGFSRHRRGSPCPRRSSEGLGRGVRHPGPTPSFPVQPVSTSASRAARPARGREVGSRV